MLNQLQYLAKVMIAIFIEFSLSAVSIFKFIFLHRDFELYFDIVVKCIMLDILH